MSLSPHLWPQGSQSAFASALKTKLSFVAYPILLHLLTPLLTSLKRHIHTARTLHNAWNHQQGLEPHSNFNALTVTVAVGLAEIANVTYLSHWLNMRLNHHEKLFNHYGELLNEHAEQLADIELLTAHLTGAQRDQGHSVSCNSLRLWMSTY